MSFLLDVNVLVALLDPTHVSHDVVHEWFDTAIESEWATCPITENGVVRIISHPRYPNTPGSPVVVTQVLGRLKQRRGHAFWSDDISLLDGTRFDVDKLLSHRQLTDSYLLALALAHGGQLASLDRRLSVSAVRGGRNGLHLIEGNA